MQVCVCCDALTTCQQCVLSSGDSRFQNLPLTQIRNKKIPEWILCEEPQNNYTNECRRQVLHTADGSPDVARSAGSLMFVP